MSDATATVATDGHAHEADHAHQGGHAHPTDKLFIRTALILAAITAVEVAWSYLPWGETSGLVAAAEIGGLLAMMAVKFVIVAGTFMHLKFDNRLLTRVFYSGLILAIGVYLAVLAAFEFFGDDSAGYCPANLRTDEISVCEPASGREMPSGSRNDDMGS